MRIKSVCYGVIAVLFVTSHGEAAQVKNPALGQEIMEEDEDVLTESLKVFSMDLIKNKYPPGKRPARRDAHPKTFGVVTAEFIVLDHLPQELRYGVFKVPRKFDALIRFSAGGDSIKPDNVQERRGMAIKLLGVEGEKLLDAERYEKTQDFVLMNFPAFAASNLRDYLEFFRSRLAGPEKFNDFLRKHPEIAQRLREMDEVVVHNPFEAQYWSTTPYKLGPKAMKFSAKPLRSSTQKPQVPLGPDYLREALLKQIMHEDVTFEFLIQTQVDPVKMPIENSMVVWDEKLSPYRRVALIRIPKQDPRAIKDLELAETLSFTPWHALPDLRPLGSINRSRRSIYEALSTLRHDMNGSTRREPTELPRP
jgi:hypothetical protein